MLGRVYEYFLGQFASNEGKNAGEFYTPRSVVQLLVEMLQPYHGRVFDPACGSGGMFVQADKFVARPWRQPQRHLRLRPGVQPDDLAAGEDEPRRPRHRGQPRPGVGRLLPRRRPPRPARRLRHRQSAVQRQQVGRRAAARRTRAGSTAPRRRRTPTTPGSSTSCTTAPPPAPSAPSSPTARCPASRAARARSARRWSRPTWSSASSRCPPQLFYGTQIPVCLWFLTKNKAGVAERHRRRDRGRARPSSSTPGRSATWRRARCAPSQRRGLTRIADAYHAWRGTETSDGQPTPTSRASAAPSAPPRSPSTAMCSRRAVCRQRGSRGRRRAARREDRPPVGRDPRRIQEARGTAGDRACGPRLLGGCR